MAKQGRQHRLLVDLTTEQDAASHPRPKEATMKRVVLKRRTTIDEKGKAQGTNQFCRLQQDHTVVLQISTSYRSMTTSSKAVSTDCYC